MDKLSFLSGYLDKISGVADRGRRDGTGPHAMSAMRSVSDKGRKLTSGEECPVAKNKRIKEILDILRAKQNK